MTCNARQDTPELGTAPPVTYNHLFLKFHLIFCSEGVPIFPVMRESVSSPIKTSQNASPKFRRTLKPLAFVLLCFTVFSAWAQQQTITQIRVIGNRRIPKETVLARLFTHPGDVYDPISIERDFNSLWNTGYFDNLRIEREDSEKGIILDSANLGWKNFQIRESLEKEFKCPTVVLNDVDSGVFGEYRFGAGKNARCVIGVFPGTGIGGGCVYEGQVLRGKNVSCLEIGHVQINPSGQLCGCGRIGCLETEASRLAIAAAEAHRAGVAGGHVAEGIASRQGEVLGHARGRVRETGDVDAGRGRRCSRQTSY